MRNGKKEKAMTFFQRRSGKNNAKNNTRNGQGK